jgi:hypothetical protein
VEITADLDEASDVLCKHSFACLNLHLNLMMAFFNVDMVLQHHLLGM